MLISILQRTLGTLLLLGSPLAAFAAEPASPDADEIARKVYAVSHNEQLDKAISKRTGRLSSMVINRVPLEMRQGRKPYIQTFDTYINNRPADPAIDTLQMAILTSGKAKDSGVLFTRFTDPQRSGIISLWLPALRKVRQINEPAHDDTWFGTIITYGELVLRTPEHETHEYLGEGTLDACLDSMEFEPWEQNRYTQQLPGPQCAHQGKAVHRLKSTTLFENWWYDYHVTDIDQATYWPYRTVYFKDDRKIKSVWVDWQPLGQPDANVAYPRYIYALSHEDGKDSLVFVPRNTISLNTDTPDNYWSVETMRNYLK
jgi:hypothetical protein